MFGQQQKKPFAFGATTGFGQTNTFGQPAQTSVFGQTSTFGTTTTQQTGGIFGSTPTSGGLFGQTTSAFGQPQPATQNTSFFGTPQQPAAQPSLFGATQPSTNVFGATSFGAQPRPSFGFGTTATPSAGGLFGQQTTTTQSATGGLFGTPNTSVFGGTASFGAVPVGTTVPFKVVNGTDTMMKNGTTTNIQTQHQCITCMKEYESKSLEELRMEDYQANRKQGNQAATGAFGTPAPAAGSSLFGAPAATPSSSFGFGNTTQNKPLFGSTGFNTSAQPTSTFGQTSTATPFGSTAPATSVFGQPATSTGFGFGATAATAAKPAFGFGATAAPATTQAATSAFGMAKPFGATPAFGTSTASPFGATSTANQAKPALGFGTSGFGSTFGATASTASPFSFGAPTTTTQSSSLFGAKPATTGAFGATQPFSFPSTAGASAFGATGTSLAKPFTATTGFGATPTGGLFGSTFNQPAAMAAQPQAADASRIQQVLLLTSRPITGDSFFMCEPKKDQLRPTSLAAQKAVLEESSFKPKTPPASKVKSVPMDRRQLNSSMFAGLDDADSQFSTQSPKHFTIRPKSPPKKSLSIFECSISQTEDPAEVSNQNDSVLNVGPAKSPIASTPMHPAIRVSAPIRSPAMTSVQEETSLHLGNERSVIVPDEAYNPENENSINVTLKRPGYYTRPPLSFLKLDKNGECFVEDFVVGRRGFGSVKFLGRMNVKGLNLDETVIFRRKEITVYPDESQKPPLGQGLNRKAEVTLETVYPVDKSRGEMITRPEELIRLKFREKLEKFSTRMGARFLDYDETIGQWVFAVNHFSRYGLLDDDDDDFDMIETRPLPQVPLVPAPKIVEKPPCQEMEITQMNVFKPKAAEYVSPEQQYLMYNTMDFQASMLQSSAFQNMKASMFMDECDEDAPYEKDVIWSVNPNAKSHFEKDPMESEVERKKIRMTPPHDKTAKTQHQPKKHLRMALHNADEFLEKFPKIATIRPEVDPMDERGISLAAASFQRSVGIGDLSIFNRFRKVYPTELSSFNQARARPNFHRWTLVRSSDVSETRCLDITRLGHSKGVSSVLFEDISFKTSTGPLKELMEVEKANSDVTFERSGLPYWTPQKGTRLMTNHIQRLNSKEDILEVELFNALTLCDALWGDGIAETSDPIEGACARKRALSSWITRVTEGVISEETCVEGSLQCILSYVSGHQIGAACEEAVLQSDYNLATLIAQAAHDQTTKTIVKNMYAEWTESKKDQFISRDRLKIYAMMAGIPEWTLSDGSILNVCEGFDWLRCFAIHMWYICPSNMTIPEVLEAYVEASQSYATPPEVKHGDGDTDSPLHVCFQLMRLFADCSSSIEKILCPDTVLSVQSQLEYRHSWLLAQVLQSLGYQVPCLEELHVRISSELEAQGLWDWAVFALLHVESSAKRQKYVFDLICKHAVGTVEMSEDEDFVHRQLKVPKSLIYKAKALRAGYENRRVNQTKLLLLAGEVSEAHEVFMVHLAVKGVINERFELLEELLTKMNADFTKIASWNYRGRVYFNYIQLKALLRQILDAKDDDKAVEKILDGNSLEAVLASLSSKLSRLPRDTVEQRLCQIEMAKTTFAAYKNVLTLKSASDPHLKNSAVRSVFQLLQKLPLPEDTVAQEFRRLSEEYPKYLPKE